MPNTMHQFLKEQIYQAILHLLSNKAIPLHDPLEYHLDKILQKTLSLCAQHFLKHRTLQQAETQTLKQLLKNITDNIDMIQIERQLFQNLTKIKPMFGEIFGTDRGAVYNCFRNLIQWPCFQWHTRLYYKALKENSLSLQISAQSSELIRKHSDLSTASLLIQEHEKTTNSQSTRIASQFILIQELRIENARQKEQLLSTEKKLKALEPHRAQPRRLKPFSIEGMKP